MVFEDVYSFSYFREEFLDKFYDFISYCVIYGYYIRWVGFGVRSRVGLGVRIGSRFYYCFLL